MVLTEVQRRSFRRFRDREIPSSQKRTKSISQEELVGQGFSREQARRLVERTEGRIGREQEVFVVNRLTPKRLSIQRPGEATAKERRKGVVIATRPDVIGDVIAEFAPDDERILQGLTSPAQKGAVFSTLTENFRIGSREPSEVRERARRIGRRDVGESDITPDPDGPEPPTPSLPREVSGGEVRVGFEGSQRRFEASPSGRRAAERFASRENIGAKLRREGISPESLSETLERTGTEPREAARERRRRELENLEPLQRLQRRVNTRFLPVGIEELQVQPRGIRQRQVRQRTSAIRPSRERGALSRFRQDIASFGQAERKGQALSTLNLQTGVGRAIRDLPLVGRTGKLQIAGAANVITQSFPLFTDTQRTLRRGKRQIEDVAERVSEEGVRSTAFEIGSGLRRGLQSSPTFAGAGFVGEAALTGAASRGLSAARRSFTFLDDFEIPTTDGRVRVRAGGVKTPSGRRAVLFSSKDGVPRLGRVDISDELRRLDPSQDIKFGGAGQTSIFKKALGRLEGDEITERGREAIGVGETIARRTRGVESSFIEDTPLRTKRLDERTTRRLIEELGRDENLRVFGSGARRKQIPREVSEFEPRDIDFTTRDEPLTEEKLLRVREKGRSILEEEGFETRVKEGSPEAVEVRTEEGFRKAFEIKGPGDFVDDVEAPDTVFGIRKRGRPVNIGGQEFSPLEQELRGVLQGAIRVRRTDDGLLDVFPPINRRKDIESVRIAGETLRRSRVTPSPTLTRALERFDELFGDFDSGSGRVLLADFPSDLSVGRRASPGVGRSFAGLSILRRSPGSLSTSINAFDDGSISSIGLSRVSDDGSISSSISRDVDSDVSSVSSVSGEEVEGPSDSLISSIKSPDRSLIESPSQAGSISEGSVSPGASGSISEGPSSISGTPSIVSSSAAGSEGGVSSSGAGQSATPRRFPDIDKDVDREGTFDVQVGRPGNDVYFVLDDVSEREVREAVDVVENSPAASIKIESNKRGVKAGDFLGRGFRKGKSGKGFFVEKNENRIDSSGEFEGITAKGILSSRGRGKKRNSNGGSGGLGLNLDNGVGDESIFKI